MNPVIRSAYRPSTKLGNAKLESATFSIGEVSFRIGAVTSFIVDNTLDVDLLDVNNIKRLTPDSFSRKFRVVT
jgi:hypothetical protein